MLEHTQADIAVFPELSLTSYMCEDLFFQRTLQIATAQAINTFLATNPFKGVVIFGAPIPKDGNLYNAAVVVQKDSILGIVPKMHLPNLQEFREKRWFTSGSVLASKRKSIEFLGKEIPFGSILFKDVRRDVKFGVEICEDLWTPLPPGTKLSMRGADIIFNLSACDAYIGKRPMRKRLVLETSRRNAGAYVFCNVNPDDSSERYLFTGHDLIAQCGNPIKEGDAFTVPSGILSADIDIWSIRYYRSSFSSFRDGVHSLSLEGPEVSLTLDAQEPFTLEAPVNPFPFLPDDTDENGFQTGLALHKEAFRKSLRRFDRNTALLIMDGSLESILTLFSAKDILQEEKALLKHLKAQLKRTSDTPMDESAVKTLLKSLEIPYTVEASPEETLSNASTLVIEPVSMSRVAFEEGSWLQASRHVYHLNAGIPSTLVPYLLKQTKTYGTLSSTQKEAIDGHLNSMGTKEAPYALHDFVLSRMLRSGDPIDRVAYLASLGFNKNEATVKPTVERLYQTFNDNQDFIRRHLNSPKILDVSLNDFYFYY